MSTGSAYRYYLRQVAVGDGRRPRGKGLDQAQEEAGVPPGVWMGRALPAVGLTAGARVTEGQMRNLFGEGLHPDADRIVEERLAAGDSPAAAARAARLGYRIQKWSGIDLVFRPPASVQALWALATEPVQQLIEDIHTRISAETLTAAGSVHVEEQRFYSSSGGTSGVGAELMFTAMDSTAHRRGCAPPSASSSEPG
ncbi:relaxase domain-containing protein [Streptomyces sp. NPDC005151]